MKNLKIAATALACVALAGCSSGSPAGSPRAGNAPDLPSSSSSSSPSAPETPTVVVRSNVKPGAHDVAVDKVVQLSTSDGTLESVRLASKAGTVDGSMSKNDTTWTAGSLLEPGTTYTVKTVAADADGQKVRKTTRFSTVDLSLDQQTYPSVAPLQGETVGIGMPVIVTFDVPVTDKASIEKHLKVTSSPQQAGSWHWISSQEVHWRPKTYWQAGTDVSVDVNINSIPAGNGIFGQEDRHVDFHIGDAHIYKVNTKTDQMQVFSNGKLLRTLPITTGEQPRYTTRSGTKVIIEKFASKDMNSETVGITGADAYNIKGVQWAMRVTYSGEFIHAAPWSVAYQGHSNVSHGCTGMSTENAKWLFDMTRRGDVVEYTGTDKPMTLTNGYGDWNESFATYRQGSAL